MRLRVSRSPRWGGTRIEIWRRFLTRPAIVYVVLTALSFPILELILERQQAVQYVHDVLDGDLPLLAAIGADWARYGPSLWDPHVTAGNATLAQLALSPFTPDLLLSFFLPLFRAYALAYALLIWVAGYGMHRFLRDSLQVRSAAAFVGGVAYCFSFWHYIHGFAVPLLPLILWMTDRAITSGNASRLRIVALIALQTFALYAGLLQLAVIVGFVQLGYLLFRAPTRRVAARFTALWAGIWVVSGILFAPVLVTLLAYLGSSQRATWQLTEFVDSRPIPALVNWLALYANAFVGVPLGSRIAGSADVAGTYYTGPILLLLIVVGVMHARDRARWFFPALLVAIPVLDLASVLATPFQSHLGLLSSFQFVRVRHLLPFALAANAALGAEVLLRNGWRSLQSKPVIAALVSVGGLLVAQLVISAGKVAAAAGQRPPWSRSDTGWLFAALSISVGLAASVCFLITRRGRFGPHLATVVVVALLLFPLVGERVAYARAERYLHGGLGTWAEYMSINPAKAFVANSTSGTTDRVMTTGADPNTVALAGVDEVGGYQSVYPQRYQNLYGAMTDPYLLTNSGRWWYFHRWGSRAYVFGPGIQYPIADLLGVRWIYAQDMQLSGPRLTPRFHWGNVTVYENANAFPRAFVVGRLRRYSSDVALVADLARVSATDLREAAFVVGAGPPIQGAGSAALTSTARIVDYQPDRVEIAVTSSAEGVLVLADTYAPGWTVTVNGHASTIYPVDEALRGVLVPPGQSRVVFAYRPWFTHAGFILAALGALGLIVFSALGLWRDRRRPSGLL